MNNSSHPVIIVGSGFFGAVMARCIAENLDRRVLIIERRDHIGGNSWSELDPETGVEVHKYGSHIFHTDKQHIWNFITRFTDFNTYRHKVLTTHRGKVYSMPINLGTINQFYGMNLSPPEVDAFLKAEIQKADIGDPANLEEKAISLIGGPLYEAFIKGYTLKHWKIDPRELPAEIVTRLPVRTSYNTDYFNDPWQGIPLDGYGRLFERLLDHDDIEVQLGTDYFDVRDRLPADTFTIYTGPIDRFFDYRHGHLDWIALRFEREIHDIPDYQGTSVMNWADPEIPNTGFQESSLRERLPPAQVNLQSTIGNRQSAMPFTRIHEFKHFHPERECTGKTTTFKEYSLGPGAHDDAYYPVNIPRNQTMLAKYRAEVDTQKNILIGGRLGAYRYYDMDDAIDAALIAYELLAERLRVSS